MTDQTLIRAQGGDELAFRELTEPYRRELQLHCYRILGSLQDAEDLVQETLLAAWRGLAKFEGRASVRGWLYRIATNRCLNFLRDRGRRPRVVPPMADPPEPTRRAEPVWLEPYPDTLLEAVADSAPGPAARYEQREAVGLAFVAALQHLPARQRAVLVLRDVLGYQGAEVAAILGTTDTAVKGALQRARATLDSRLPTDAREHARAGRTAHERTVVERFTDAVERGDMAGLVALLTDDAWLTMPPQPFEYQGPAAIGAFLADRQRARGVPLRLVPTRANGQPAFGCYLPEGAGGHPYGVLVLELREDRIAAITWFSELALFPRLGLPESLPRPS